MHQSTLIFIPTYNEKENVENLCLEILNLGIKADILFLDDNSPDGTGAILDLLAKKHNHVKVIHRSGKLGIGSAHLEGIHWAYEHHYSILITMDCDFTHKPEDIEKFISCAKDCQIVIGSRYIKAQSLSEWNLFRKTLTLLGHFLTKYLLKMKYDASGAFRLYSLDSIDKGIFDQVESKGYSFFFESLFFLNLNGIAIKEISISLPARTYGHSKMSLVEAGRSVHHLIRLYFRGFWLKRHKISHRPKVQDSSIVKDNQNWDHYWETQKKEYHSLYGFIAAFYRKFIIKRNLNYFIRKHFFTSHKLLHAGCGSGQVDTNVSSKYSVTALDISLTALKLYQQNHKEFCKIVLGSNFSLPFKDKSFNGIYHLGLMEHFTEDEINGILSEFNRVLKTDGKMVIFWPPEFGTSVIVLKMIHFILNKVFKKNIKLHPDEITRIKSKKQVTTILMKAKFNILEYHFGPRDFFTQCILVVAKE